MNKQDKIIVGILVGALLTWMFFFMPKPPPAKSAAPPSATGIATPSTTIATPSAPPVGSAPVDASAISAPTSPAPVAKAPLPPEQTAHLKNDFIDVELTSYGGGVRSVKLLKYQIPLNGATESAKPAKQNIVLNRYGKIPALALEMADANQGSAYSMIQKGDTVTFETTTPMGVKVRKVFSLAAPQEFGTASDYVVKSQIQFELANGGGAPTTLKDVAVSAGAVTPRGSDEGGMIWMLKWIDNRGMYLGAETNIVKAGGENETQHHYFASIQKTPMVKKEPTNWVAVKNQYFTMVLTPKQAAAGATAREITIQSDEELPRGMLPSAITGALVLPEIQLQAGKAVTQDFTLYAGPKEYKRLMALSKTLGGLHQDDLMQFGRFIVFQLSWLSVICKLMLLSLLLLNKVVGNFGIAILILTAAIRGAFWPLTGYGTRQMNKMKELQPELQAIREKYADSFTKLHEEQQKLMKKNKVNQMGGCLPQLVQIPVFVAFYSILVSATELWGAKFLWVQDLTQPDSLFMIGSIRFDLMLILMAASQVWLAKLTPATDPTQAKMAMFMPLFMVLMMYAWKFSAALVLYWTVSNLFTIVQTYLTRPKHAQTAAPLKTLAKLK